MKIKQPINKYLLFAWGLLTVTIFWFFVSYPFFSNAFIPTHDGEYHIIRIYEFFTMLKSGYFFPRWAPGLNSGYGVPLFNFHYPLPNYVGSLFHFFGFSLVDSFKLTLATGYLSALIACYFIFVKKSSVFTSSMASIIFGTVPYWFVDLYIRGSVGEVWGIAWGMIAFASIVWQIPIVLSLSVALIILSHNIMAMLILPVLFLYIFIKKKSLLINLFFGIGLSAYFWLPALLERGYMKGLNSTTFSDHFPEFFQLLVPSWGSGFSGPGVVSAEMSQQIGIIPVTILGLAIFRLFRKHRKKTSNIVKENYLPQLFLFVSLACIVLMTQISMPIWNTLTFMQYIQYPWRLLSLVTISIPFLFIFSFQKKYLQILIVGFSIIAVYAYTKPVLYLPRNDEYYLSRQNFTDGTSSLGNSFSTIWTPWKEERVPNRIEVLSGNANITAEKLQTMTDSFSIISTESAQVRVNRLYYPGWVVYLNGQKTHINYEDVGVLDFKVDPGNTQVRVKFESTPLRMIANIISVVSIILLLILELIKKIK